MGSPVGKTSLYVSLSFSHARSVTVAFVDMKKMSTEDEQEVVQPPVKGLPRAQKFVCPVSEGLSQQFSLELTLAGSPVSSQWHNYSCQHHSSHSGCSGHKSTLGSPCEVVYSLQYGDCSFRHPASIEGH